ncbi:MAG: enoyl-CoA hydratase/isomerase family protein [Chloroflexi bacterium]|nr:enoyl-CoA hydratase/isomerase family protein [Chloroflexota bacterium]
MEFVKYDKSGRVVEVTLNRPERLNALGSQVRAELAQAWKMLADDQEARVAILTGTGRAFCAGMDIKEMGQQRSPAEMGPDPAKRPFHPRMQPKPVVAAVNGLALGAGFDLLAMGADICIAAESATFGMPEVVHGVFSLGTLFAVHHIPLNIAMELVLLADNITAQRAYQIGLVNKVTTDNDLMSEARRVAGRIAEYPPLAVQLIRRNLLKATEASEAAYTLEHYLRSEVGASEDFAEGVKAFAERKKAT